MTTTADKRRQEEAIREGLRSISLTHPYWSAVDQLLDKAVDQESVACALAATSEESLKQCGRISMMRDFATTLRALMLEVRSKQPDLAGKIKP